MPRESVELMFNPCWSLGLFNLGNALQWRLSEHDGVSDHQPHDCLLNSLFRCRSKKTSKLRVTGLCVWNSPVTGEFPKQMAIYVENVSIWWRLHESGGLGVNSICETRFHLRSIDDFIIRYSLWSSSQKVLITLQLNRYHLQNDLGLHAWFQIQCR